MIPGSATAAGTGRYAARFGQASPAYFRAFQHLTASSIGLGTHGGAADADTDRLYEQSVSHALTAGCNVLDTAVAYRHQRSERTIGRSLAALIEQGRLARDEVIVSSKAGFLPFDSDYTGTVWDYYQETFLQTGLVHPAEIVAPGHCIAPAFLRHQIDTSRRNLGCSSIDVFYLHNPDTQLQERCSVELYRRVRAAFEELEAAAASGLIGVYGVSTWQGFTPTAESPEALSLVELERCARDVAGERHRFRAVMLPINTARVDAAAAARKTGEGSRLDAVLDAAEERGLTVTAASALNGGRLARGPCTIAGGSTMTPAQLAVQYRLAHSWCHDGPRGDEDAGAHRREPAIGVRSGNAGVCRRSRAGGDGVVGRSAMSIDMRSAAVQPPQVGEHEAVLLIERGEQHASQAEYAEAEACFRQVITADERLRDDPTDPAALGCSARGLLSLGRVRGVLCDFADAAAHLERSAAIADQARSLGWDPAEAALTKARALLALGRLEGARACVEAARGRFAAAVPCYEEAIAASSAAVPLRLAEMHLALGRLHAGLQHAASAESHYRVTADLSSGALACDSRDSSAATLLGKALSGLGRLNASLHQDDQARASFTQAIAAFDDALCVDADSADARTRTEATHSCTSAKWSSPPGTRIGRDTISRRPPRRTRMSPPAHRNT